MKVVLNSIIILLALSSVFFSSCKEKPQPKEIIVSKPKDDVKKGTQAMQETNNSRDIEWLGAKYTITIHRAVDKSLPLTLDEYGQDYYDNIVSVRVLRTDGSEAFNHTFHKTDFTKYITDKNVCKTGALLGVVFDKVENGNLVFAASVGSPNDRSDEYVPLVVHVNRLGAVSVTLDTNMDAEVPQADNASLNVNYDDEGV